MALISTVYIVGAEYLLEHVVYTFCGAKLRIILNVHKPAGKKVRARAVSLRFVRDESYLRGTDLFDAFSSVLRLPGTMK